MKLPLTVRLMYHGLRATIAGGLILVIGWIVFIPASRAEAEALGVDGLVRYPYGLREMRVARVFVAIAPDNAYDLAARFSGQDLQPWMLRLIVSQVASGNVPRPPQGTQQGGAATPPDSARAIEGPRFIQVD